MKTSRYSRPGLVLVTIVLLAGHGHGYGHGNGYGYGYGQAVLDIPGRSDATPWVAARGAFVAVAWGATNSGKTDVFAAVSRDGGATFAAPVRVNTVEGEARLGGELPPRVAIVNRRGASQPEVVVVWTARAKTTTIKMARSRDGGATFAAPVALQAANAPGDRGWAALAVDPRGTAHAIWLDHRGLAGGTGHTPGATHDGVAMAQKSALFYASAKGEHSIANGVCYCCKTALAAGADGTLYAAWRHVYAGNHRDMAFSLSRDGGKTFSAPVRISDDGWEINGCPDDGPALATDGGTTVHVVWPTVVGGTTPEGAIFYASTRDGRAFTPRLRIPTLGGAKPSHPQIAIDRGGRTFVAWDETVNGRRVAAMRELRRTGDRITFGDPIVISANGPGSYPVLTATDGGVLAVWTTGGETSRIETRILTP